MRYLGSKRRIAKEILRIMLKDRKPNQYFIDLFTGSASVAQEVTGNVIANDIHPELIAMYKALQEGWIPPKNITKEQYNYHKNNKIKDQEALRAFIGFGCSFGGRWFEGYAQGGTKSDGTPRSYAEESFNNLVKQAYKIKHITFTNKSYEELIIPPCSIIYCDPPYANTKGYKSTNKFNHELFYKWCLEQHEKGHKIYISEHNMPEQFKSIWQKELTVTCKQDNYITATEKLFIPSNATYGKIAKQKPLNLI